LGVEAGHLLDEVDERLRDDPRLDAAAAGALGRLFRVAYEQLAGPGAE
jgi:hypothetical protein